MCDFFLGEKFKLTDKFHLIDFVQTVDSLANGLEVGESATEPSLVDVEHIATFCLLFDGVLCLFLRADEENGFAFCCNALYKVVSGFDVIDGDLKVDDVNVVSGCIDVLAHFRIPTFGLMSEVYACFEQGFHCCYGHFKGPPIVFYLSQTRRPNLRWNRTDSSTMQGRLELYYI